MKQRNRTLSAILTGLQLTSGHTVFNMCKSTMATTGVNQRDIIGLKTGTILFIPMGLNGWLNISSQKDYDQEYGLFPTLMRVLTNSILTGTFMISQEIP